VRLTDVKSQVKVDVIQLQWRSQGFNWTQGRD